MKKLALVLMFLPLCVYAQTGVVQGHCYLGGTPATTSGMNSSNYMNGIIPACSVTVYLTGTTNKQTITKPDGSALANPFFANTASAVDPGGWIFRAATNAGLDVVMSGGNSNASCTTAPLCYTQPVTLTAVFPSQSFTPVSGVISINGIGGVYTFNGSGVSCSGTTCTFSGAVAGVTSLNSLNGALNLVGDSSITVTPSGSNINLHATGTGGSGVQYNPTTTAYIVTSFSGLYDDGDANSTSLGVPTSVSCDGLSPSTCTVTFAAAHGLSVGGAVDMFNLSTWPAGPGGVQQAAQYGSFQVTTVPDSTHITFTTPTVLTYTCGPCTGNVYDASYWGIWAFAREPYIYGHGTVYGIESTTSNLDTNFTTLTSGITGSPIFLIDQTGQNDFAAGATPAQVNTSHQSVWAKAHAAGMQVVQSSITTAKYGLTGVGTYPGQLNILLWPQNKNEARVATGQYYDRWVDTASVLNIGLGATAVLPDQEAAQKFADKLNEAFSTQKSIFTAPPDSFTFSVNGLGGNGVPAQYTGDLIQFYDSNWNHWMDWRRTAGSPTIGTAATANTPIYNNTFATQVVGTTWYDNVFGVDSTNTNNSFNRGFHYAGTGSTSNYMAFAPTNGTDVIRFFADGGVQLPNVATAPNTSPVCPNGTNGELVTTGCLTGGGSSPPYVKFATTTGAVASTSVASVTSPAATYTAGDVIVVSVRTNTAGRSCTFSSTPAATWNALTGQNGTTTQTILMGWAVAPGGSTTVTCTLDVSDTFVNMITLDLTGVSGTLNASAGATGSVAVVTVPLATTGKTFNILCGTIASTASFYSAFTVNQASAQLFGTDSNSSAAQTAFCSGGPTYAAWSSMSASATYGASSSDMGAKLAAFNY